MKPGNETLATLDEQTLQKAVSAWHWLHVYMAGRGHGLPEGTRIADAMMSKFVPPCVILKHRPSTMVVASLGNRTWGALGLPLRAVRSTLRMTAATFSTTVSNPAARSGGSRLQAYDYEA